MLSALVTAHDTIQQDCVYLLSGLVDLLRCSNAQLKGATTHAHCVLLYTSTLCYILDRIEGVTLSTVGTSQILFQI
jgi:hypothetical protein